MLRAVRKCYCPRPAPARALAGAERGRGPRRAETDVSGGERDVRPCKGPVGWAGLQTPAAGPAGPQPPATAIYSLGWAA